MIISISSSLKSNRFTLNHVLLLPIFYFFLFFPYIGFVKGIDIQPNYFLAGLIFVFFSFRNFKLSKGEAIAVFFVLIPITIRFCLEVNRLDSRYLFTYYMAIISPFLIYGAIKNNLLNIKLSYMVWISVAYVTVGSIQIFFPDFLASSVSRSADHVHILAETGRGVRSLTSEPSALGHVLISLNLIIVALIYFEKKSRPHLQSIIVTLSFFLLSFLIPSSAYALSIHLLLFLFLLFFISKFAFLFFSAILFLLFYAADFSAFDGRVFRIISSVFNNPEFIFQQGAFARVMNIPISIYGGVMHGLFGAGNTAEVISSSINVFGYEYAFAVSNRNLGGVIEMFLRFGVLSIPFYLLYFYTLYRISLIKFNVSGKVFRIGVFLAAGLFLTGFQYGPIVDPLRIIPLVYFYCMSKNLMGSSISQGVKN